MTNARRILVIDENRAVHEHVRTLLWAGALQISAQHDRSSGSPNRGDDADDSPNKLGDTGAFMVSKGFDLSFATTGPDGLTLVQQSVADSNPFAVAIVDISIGPDFDGVETVRRIWAIDPDVQIVLCAQHFDYSWSHIANCLPKADSYLILRKPFHKHEIVQIIYALTEKWALRREIEEANEKRYRALYHDAPAMFFTFSRRGVVLSANDYAADQLGYTSGGIEGKSWKDLHPSGVLEDYKAHLRACIANPESVLHWQGPKICHDGTSRWVREASRVVIAPSGEQTVLSVCNDITQARRLERMLVHQSKHDLLTGLVNRAELEQRLTTLINSDSDGSHALILIDLDQFRVVNDAAGHQGGDELLRQVTYLLKEALTSLDTAARLAGDQFMVLRLMCSPEEARAFAEGLRDTLNAFRFVTQGKSFFVGASCGVIPFSTVSVDNVTTLIEAAEFACDAAKDAGRNKVCLLGLDSREVTARHSETRWVTKIQEALDEDRFELYQQPIVPTNPNRDRGSHYEILLRLRTEDGSIVPPGAFMPAAERFGMVRKLDEWVVKSTLAWLNDNPRHCDNLALVSINLSGRSLGSEEYLATLVEALEGAPHQKLCFEVTETGAIGNLAHAVEFIDKVRSLGCSFALDDFGSGLSSFGYLRQLPVDYLKIDGSLIKNIAVDEKEFAMVRSIAEVARTLGKQTVAEFVEDQAILDKLVELDIDFAQGYHLGRPMPLSDLADVPTSVREIFSVR